MIGLTYCHLLATVPCCKSEGATWLDPQKLSNVMQLRYETQDALVHDTVLEEADDATVLMTSKRLWVSVSSTQLTLLRSG